MVNVQITGGIDENGLGPRLGPLVITGVLLEQIERSDLEWMRMLRRVGFDDSKRVASFGHMAHTESRALALIERAFGVAPDDYHTLLKVLCPEEQARLTALCPNNDKAQCWGHNLKLPAFGGKADDAHEALDVLAAQGLRIKHARSVMVCARIINNAKDLAQSRFSLELDEVVRLIRELNRWRPSSIVCGQIGGIRDYLSRIGDALSLWALPLASKDEFVKDQRFQMGKVGTLQFAIDADARFAAVAIASMIGKYLRELAMRVQYAFYQKHDAGFEQVSGYHDPKTRRFIDASQLLRKRLGLDERCFQR